MGGEEEAGEEQPKWKPRPVDDPMDPLELGGQALFISKEKSDRMAKTGKNNVHLSQIRLIATLKIQNS